MYILLRSITLTPLVCTVGTDPGCIPDIIQTRASSMEVQGSTPGFEFIYQSTSAGYTSAKNSCEDMGGKNTFQIIKLIHSFFLEDGSLAIM